MPQGKLPSAFPLVAIATSPLLRPTDRLTRSLPFGRSSIASPISSDTTAYIPTTVLTSVLGATATKASSSAALSPFTYALTLARNLIAASMKAAASDSPTFCRKTTLTKHFKRYHPIKGDDAGMPDVEEEDEDVCADSDDDESCSESEANRPDTQMKRQSSYYGDHWRLPCETAQLPNPAGLQGQLVLRPKSTVDRVKYERPRSVSPQLIRSIPPADGSTSTFRYSRDRTMSIQTQMDQDFNQVPIPNPYTQEQRVGDAGSPRQYRMENSIDSLTSPSTMQSSPTVFSDISAVPDSAHSTLFFPGPTSQPYAPPEESASLGYQAPLALEGIQQEPAEQASYEVDSKPMIQMQFMCDESQMPTQQQLIQPIAYYDNGVTYQPSPIEQYYGPAPTWYTNIKPEASWPGLMPSERLNTYSGWSQ
ncbi:MAG: hypothetical protein Q9200_002145 [Gallowayella weberi]